MKKVVVMGGSFNPPTIAHQKMLIYVVEQLGANKGVFVPSPYDYVYAKMEQKGMPEEALSDELRLAMLRAGEDGAKEMCHSKVWELLMQHRNNK